MAELSSPRVVCAAIKHKSGIIICGARHFDTLMVAQMITYDDYDWASAEQGFIDQHCNFLTRGEAWDIAEKNGQIIRHFPEVGTLFSENLY